MNLHASDTGELMCKGWTIATFHSGVHKHLNLPFQKNNKKSYCESGRPLQSAFYTPVFAEKVLGAIQFQDSWSPMVTSDLQQPAGSEQAVCSKSGDHQQAL